MNDLMLVFNPIRDVAVATNFFGFMLLLASVHRIGFACDLLDGGIRQDVQVLCRQTK